MPDAAIRARTPHRNISHRSHDDITVVLVPAHNRGAKVASACGYTILTHPCGFEVATDTGWHCHTAATYHDALDYVRECEVLHHV